MQPSVLGAGYSVGYAIPRHLGELSLFSRGAGLMHRLSLEEVFLLFEHGYGVK